MLSPALQQSIAWHKEQSTRVRAYQPKKPAIPGNWQVPGGCDDCVPPPPPASTTKPVMPTTELFTVPASTSVPVIIVLATIGAVLFARQLK
jgi:hypothetical protein